MLSGLDYAQVVARGDLPYLSYYWHSTIASCSLCPNSQNTRPLRN
jgi:hypothetical protein